MADFPIFHCSHAPPGQLLAMGAGSVLLINGTSAVDPAAVPGQCPWNADVVAACATCPRKEAPDE